MKKCSTVGANAFGITKLMFQNGFLIDKYKYWKIPKPTVLIFNTFLYIQMHIFQIEYVTVRCTAV